MEELSEWFDLVEYEISDVSKDVEIELESGERITESGTAMLAWARMQFDDVPEEERERMFEALLRYCELDTLGMVMIYQHWDWLRNT